MIDLCDRWGKLPSEILAEPAEVLQLLELVRLGRGDVDEGEVIADAG